MDYTKDPRYGKPGWTLIRPDVGTPYFVKERKKRRKAGDGSQMRFRDLKVGDILVHRSTSTRLKYVGSGKRDVAFANDDTIEEVTITSHFSFARCEYRWFDPVDGEDRSWRGEYAGVRGIMPNMDHMPLWKHTLRGLASQGYRYATEEEAAAILKMEATRIAIIERHKDGEITAEEARAMCPPWGTMLRELGLLPITTTHREEPNAVK